VDDHSDQIVSTVQSRHVSLHNRTTVRRQSGVLMSGLNYNWKVAMLCSV